MTTDPAPIADSPGRARFRRAALPLILLLALALRALWPLADTPVRLSWSNGIYTDPGTMVHNAHNAVTFGEWVLDYNRDMLVFPLMNGLTWLLFQLTGPGRAPTVFLAIAVGTATVLAIAWGLRRTRGERAARLGGLLAATCFWLVMFSRIPLAENLVAMLLAFSCVAVVRRTPWSQALAGALAVGATLFGKYHAIGFLPGLLLFVLLRERGLRGAWPLLAGGTAVFLAWLVAIFLPHREHIVHHVGLQSTGLHGPAPFAESLFDGVSEVLNTLRRSWMLFRLPVSAVLGGLFALWTLGNGAARRRRLRDGSAIWAFWFVGMWVYYSLLPYKAPRYYVLLSTPLVACAAVQLDALFAAGSFRFRAPRRWDEILPLLVWLYCLGFGFIDAIKHYASMILEYLTIPPARISDAAFDAIVAVFQRVDTFVQNLAWAGVLAIAAFLLILWHPELLRLLRRRAREFPAAAFRAGAGWALGLAVAFALFQYGWWVGHRTSFVEEARSSLPEMIAADAVLLGPLAPLLTQGTTYRSLPYFGPPGEKGLLRRYGVTHVVICGAGDEAQLEARYPGLVDQLAMVAAWPFKTLFSSTLELRRLPPAIDGIPVHDYESTRFEEGAAAAASGRWEEALAAFAAYREEGGREIPELLSLEAVCWFKLDVLDRTRERLEEAIRQRPNDPLNYQNLGVLELREGDRAAALENWLRALWLDPKNQELEKRIRELTR